MWSGVIGGLAGGRGLGPSRHGRTTGKSLGIMCISDEQLSRQVKEAWPSGQGAAVPQDTTQKRAGTRSQTHDGGRLYPLLLTVSELWLSSPGSHTGTDQDRGPKNPISKIKDH
ncbi:unnamed protein product [Lota lota]